MSHLSYNVIKDDIKDLYYIDPKNWIGQIITTYNFDVDYLIKILKKNKLRFKGEILKDLKEVINYNNIPLDLIFQNGYSISQSLKELVEILVYFGLDINDRKEKIDKIYDNMLVDKKMIELVEYKIEKGLELDILDKFIIDGPKEDSYIVTCYEIDKLIYRTDKGYHDHVLSDKEINYKKNKHFDMDDLLKWKEYFDKVEAGRKIVKYIKEALNDEFEMKPLRTRIDMRKYTDLISKIDF